MSKVAIKKSLSIAMSATFVAAITGTPIAHADTNPFGIQNLHSGYIQLADAKCGANKIKEGKCGGKFMVKKVKAKEEGKCGAKTIGKLEKEGKRGAKKIEELEKKAGTEGKCGGSR